MGKRIMNKKTCKYFYVYMMIDDVFDFYLTIVVHIVGHLEIIIIIQVRFICPLDPLYIMNLNIKKYHRERKTEYYFERYIYLTYY
jgi:hypothetical protein